jgi:hypothetical protein
MLDAVMTSGEGSPECTGSTGTGRHLGSLGVGISGSAQPTAPQLLEDNGAPSRRTCQLAMQCPCLPPAAQTRLQVQSESPRHLGVTAWLCGAYVHGTSPDNKKFSDSAMLKTI